MNVVVLSAAPQTDDESATIAGTLAGMLREFGHRVAAYHVPLVAQWQRELEQTMALRLLPVDGHGDRLIVVGAAGCVVKHPAKTIWLCAYPGVEIPETAYGRSVRAAVDRAVQIGLREARAVFATSSGAAAHFERLCSADVPILAMPLDKAGWAAAIEGLMA